MLSVSQKKKTKPRNNDEEPGNYTGHQELKLEEDCSKVPGAYTDGNAKSKLAGANPDNVPGNHGNHQKQEEQLQKPQVTGNTTAGTLGTTKANMVEKIGAKPGPHDAKLPVNSSGHQNPPQVQPMRLSQKRIGWT